MREEVIDRALDLPPQAMEASGIGDALSRVADDVHQTAEAVNRVVPTLVKILFTLVTVMVAMLVLSWWMLVVIVLIPPVYLLLGRWYLQRTAPLHQRDRMMNGARAQALLSAVHGAPTVHTYGIEHRKVRHLAVISEAAAVLRMRFVRVRNIFIRAIAVPETVSLALVLLLGFVMVSQGAQIGDVTTAVLYLVAIQWPLLFLILQLDEVQSAAASLSRIVGVITGV